MENEKEELKEKEKMRLIFKGVKVTCCPFRDSQYSMCFHCGLGTRGAITMGAMATSILPQCRASTRPSPTTQPSLDRCTTPLTTGALHR